MSMSIEGFASLIVEDAFLKMCNGQREYLVAGIRLTPNLSKNQMFNILREDSKFKNWAAYKIENQEREASND